MQELLWYDVKGRQGKAIAVERTVVLTLHAKEVAQFVLIAPGFKALCISENAQRELTIRKLQKQAESTDDDPPLPVRPSEASLLQAAAVAHAEIAPLKFAAEWTRFVTRLLGDFSSEAMRRLTELQAMKLSEEVCLAHALPQQHSTPRSHAACARKPTACSLNPTQCDARTRHAPVHPCGLDWPVPRPSVLDAGGPPCRVGALGHRARWRRG